MTAATPAVGNSGTSRFGLAAVGADEFVRRVAERMGVEPRAAWTHVRAVLGTLEREVAEMEQVRVRLPREFDALMA